MPPNARSARCRRASSRRCRRAPAEVFTRDGSSQRSGKSSGCSCAITALPVSSRRTPGGKADLRGGAEESGYLVEGRFEGAEKSRLEQHVVVQQADTGMARPRDTAIHRRRERERRRRYLHLHLRPFRREPCRGAVVRAVIDHDHFGLGGQFAKMPGSWAARSLRPLREGITTEIPAGELAVAAVRMAELRVGAGRSHAATCAAPCHTANWRDSRKLRSTGGDPAGPRRSIPPAPATRTPPTPD